MGSSPWIERATSLPVVAAIALPAYALALFTWVDTGWAPLASSDEAEFALGIAASAAFGYAVGRWWAPVAGVLVIPSVLLLEADWANASGLPLELSELDVLSLLVAAPALAIPIALGVGLRVLIERRMWTRPKVGPLLGVVGVAALGAVTAGSLYVQMRTRLATDVTPDSPETADVASGSFRDFRIGDRTSELPRDGGLPVIGGRPQTAVPSLDRTQEGFFQPPARYDPYYRSDDLTVYSNQQDRISGFITVAPNAETDRGLGLGDGLKLAQERYPNLKCERLNDAEGRAYGQTSCAGQVADDRYLWVGGNPIEALAVTTWPPG